MVSDVTELAEKGVDAYIIAVNPPYGIALPIQSEAEKLYDAIFDLPIMLYYNKAESLSSHTIPKLSRKRQLKRISKLQTPTESMKENYQEPSKSSKN